MSVARLFPKDGSHEPKRAKLDRSLVMGFSDEDKIGTIQPHDDALVIILRIGGYDVKRVISASGTHQVYTNQGEASIHYLAHGHSLNGA